MSTIGDVHVGDVGTRFKGEIQDAGSAFDPSSATSKLLIFKGPGVTTPLERTATITTTGSGASQKWYMEYVVLAADITAGLHARKGTWYWQGYVTFVGGQTYSTSIETYEVDPNLR